MDIARYVLLFHSLAGAEFRAGNYALNRFIRTRAAFTRPRVVVP
jgi:hypothetical protein